MDQAIDAAWAEAEQLVVFNASSNELEVRRVLWA